VADLLAETQLGLGHRIEAEEDGRKHVTAQVLRSGQIRGWIRMRGDAVELLSQADLLGEVDSVKSECTPRR
jgi:hypothetical protein